MGGHTYCYHPAVQYLRKLVKNKKLGKVFYGIAIRMYRLLSDDEIYQELCNKAIKAITEKYNFFYKLPKDFTNKYSV